MLKVETYRFLWAELKIGRGGCVVYMYILYIASRLFFRYPLGGCPSQAVVSCDRYNTQPARLLNGPACLPCLIACDCMRLVDIRHNHNIAPSYCTTTQPKQPTNATKLCICVVRLLRHVFYPGITACNDDFGLAWSSFCPASLVNILLGISEALLQQHHALDCVLAAPIGVRCKVVFTGFTHPF